MPALLERIVGDRPRVLIVHLTGEESLTPEVALLVLHAERVARPLGGRVILSGVPLAVVRARGVDVSHLLLCDELHDALTKALDLIESQELEVAAALYRGQGAPRAIHASTCCTSSACGSGGTVRPGPRIPRPHHDRDAFAKCACRSASDLPAFLLFVSVGRSGRGADEPVLAAPDHHTDAVARAEGDEGLQLHARRAGREVEPHPLGQRGHREVPLQQREVVADADARAGAEGEVGVPRERLLGLGRKRSGSKRSGSGKYARAAVHADDGDDASSPLRDDGGRRRSTSRDGLARRSTNAGG